MTIKCADRTFALYLTDAATQWNYMRPRQNDLEQEKKGRSFIHAIDTNVIAFWANPEQRATSRHDDRILLGAGQIFHSDTSELSAAIARGLAGFIFERLSKGPLLIIPPTHLEIEANVLARTGSVTPDPALAKQIHGLEEALVSEGFTVDQLREISPRLQELLFQNIGPHLEARRISQVLTRKRAVPLAAIDLPKEIAQILRPPGPFEGWIEYSKRRKGEGWDSKLDRYSSSKLRDNDAEVLARLETWNEKLTQLEATTSGAINYRILLVTFDHRFFHAAAAYKPSWLETDFAEAFLRHPRAFLDEEGVLRLAGDDQSGETARVANWIELLVGPLSISQAESDDYVRNRKTIPRQILDAARQLGSATESKTQKLINDWANFTRDTVTANPPSKFELSGLDSVREGGANALRKAVEKLDQEIAALRLESLQQCISAITELGFEIEFRAKHRVRARSVMPIFFERWERAETFIKEVSEWGEDEFDSERYKKGIAEVRKDDRTDYSYYLAHAALFAGRGRWMDGALLANHAREAIRLIDPKDRHGANGREAAYFEAACRRHSAKTVSDLDACRPLVDEAIEIFRTEQEIEPGLDVAAERFEAEGLALRLDSLLFARFLRGSGSNEAANTQDSFAALSRDYGGLLQRVEALIKNPPAATLGNREPIGVRRHLRNRLLLNLLALGLMTESGPEICSRSQYAIEQIETLSKAGHFDLINRRSRNFSIFHYWTAMCGRIRKAAGTAEAANLKKTLDEFFRNQMSNVEYTVFPYDRARFQEMRRAADVPWPKGTLSTLDSLPAIG